MDERAQALAQVSLVTNYFGDTQVFGEILQDWIRFLGGEPEQVVVVTDPDANRETAFVQEYKAGTSVRNAYILFFHADTLPYRQGHDDWLPRALEFLQRPDVFAISGSCNLWCKQDEAWPDWYWSNKCSLNFALMKRAYFVDAVDEFAGDFVRSNFRGENPARATGQDRYLIEVAFENYMAQHKLLTLMRHEDPTWTIFHTNTWGARLKQTRTDFFARKNIEPFLDAGANPKLMLPRDALYYGSPGLGLVRRARIRFGQTRVGPPWRALKQRLGLKF
jgi:hypothetical protein